MRRNSSSTERMSRFSRFQRSPRIDRYCPSVAIHNQVAEDGVRQAPLLANAIQQNKRDDMPPPENTVE